MAQAKQTSLAVIGLGACGLTTLKNFLEAGFSVTGFDENSYVGGLWEYSENAGKTTVLKTTVANLSKHLGCYTDFPYSDDVGDFPTAAQTAKYLNDYADRFNLRSHMRLGTKVRSIGRHNDGWMLQTLSATGQQETATFDKVAVCAGLAVQEPKTPKIPGLETFTGTAIHSNAYKEPNSFDGKRVVVVGLGNTGPDTAVDLIGHASAVWMSHRHGNAIFARRNPKGKPLDHVLSMRLTKIGGLFNKHFPDLSQKAALLGMKRMQNQAFDIKPEWNLGIPQMPTRKVATLNDELVPAIHRGDVSLKPGLTAVKGDIVRFSDNSELENIDVIIFCTGFRSDYSFMSSEADPTRETRSDWTELPGANGRPLPRLYQGIFSLDFPDSLAFLGTSPLTPQACLNYDISSAAVAQVWAGRSRLPSRPVMSAHVDAQHELVCSIARTGELANTNLRNNWEWFSWCDETAGIGLVKRMGYGPDGWKFWVQDRKLCGLVMDGLMSPHLFRLFDEGKRKPWSEAQEAVEKVNAER